MYFDRKVYLDQLIRKKHNSLVKVITGARRSGKSYLMNNIFYKSLLNEGIKEKNIIPITKANKIEHIKSNLEALGFETEQPDYQRLNDFRCEEFDILEVDWLDNGGLPIYKFANQVE